MLGAIAGIIALIVLIAGVLGIRILGAAKEGVLDPMHKCRGEAKTLETMFAEMKNFGFCGGKVKIDHCMNPGAAEIIKEKILSEFPETDAAEFFFLLEQEGGLVAVKLSTQFQQFSDGADPLMRIIWIVFHQTSSRYPMLRK